ncbi:hypothetical protein AGMMS50293_22990 [Spirochaetia bacterium]|nr:hypothetical protein AGMMS50293_22990 [Spirochaetia bacterium]
MQDTLNITAHSGCDGTADDSLESIEAAIRYGADVAEVDIRRNRQGVLVLSHDEDTSREYPGHFTLAEAFALIAQDGRIAVNCDIKETDTLPAILELAGSMGLGPERVILTGSTTPAMVENNPGLAKKAAPWIGIEDTVMELYRAGDACFKPYQNLIDSTGENPDRLLYALEPHIKALIEPVIRRCLGLGIKVINVPHREQIMAVIPLLKAQGMAASIWTVNDSASLERLFRLGVLNITTRNTPLAVESRARAIHTLHYEPLK